MFNIVHIVYMRPREIRCPLPERETIAKAAQKAAFGFFKSNMISGLSHITFVTRDIEAFARIVIEVLGGEEIYDSGQKQFSLSREKFFIAGGLWIVAMEGESLPMRSYNHIAFKTDEAGLEQARTAIARLGLETKPPRPRIEGEGRSLYFYTPDKHLIELHTGTLEERLQAYGNNG